MRSAPLHSNRLRASTWRKLCGTGAAGLLPWIAGCRRAPSYSVLGSFFPAWMFCLLAGIFLAIIVHTLLRRYDLAEQLAPPLLVYPSLAAVFCFSLWLLLFS